MPEARIDDMKTLLMFLTRSMMTSDMINCDARMAADTCTLVLKTGRGVGPFRILYLKYLGDIRADSFFKIHVMRDLRGA